MDEKLKRLLIGNYFKPMPKQFHWLTRGGAAAVIIGFFVSISAILWTIGAFFILLGISLILFRINKTATDFQMDQWLKEDIKALLDKSIERLKIDPDKISIEPIILTSPVVYLTDSIPPEDLAFKNGSDNVVRFGVYRLMFIIFCDVHTDIYQYTHNFLHNIQPTEETDEFYKQDIVTVSLKEEPIDEIFSNGTPFSKAEMLKIKISTGDEIKMIRGGQQLVKYIGVDLNMTEVEDAVAKIRDELRQRTQSVSDYE